MAILFIYFFFDSTELYLQANQNYMVEFFCKNSQRLLAVNFFCKKAVVGNGATQDNFQSLKVNFFCHFYVPFF